MSKELILILGGARGGKSTYAEELAHELGGDDVVFVATAQALDEEMKCRIAKHQAARPAAWRTLEAPSLVSPSLDDALFDCEGGGPRLPDLADEQRSAGHRRLRRGIRPLRPGAGRRS